VRLAYQKKAVRSIIDLSEQRFYPSVPEDLNQTGLNEKLIEDLIFKLLLSRGVMPGRQIADEICLPLKIIENTLSDLKRALFLTYRSNSGINDFAYILSEQGREKAITCTEASAYIGSAPVPYADYLQSFESQSIQKETPGAEELQHAFHDLVLEPHLLNTSGASFCMVHRETVKHQLPKEFTNASKIPFTYQKHCLSAVCW
jgi:hypothetical protein